MFSFLALGFLIGMGHALEADHLAAVGALATSGRSTPKKMAFLGASWGMGHTTTLFVLSAIVLLFGYVLDRHMAAGLEFFVGVMLVLLGINVFWKMHKAKVHFHIHQHDDGHKHIHAHSHKGAKVQHTNDPHHHKHGFSLRAYLVGLAHGAAGTAGLVALTAAATHDVWTALGYILVFGVGSLFGMALLTYAVSWPLRLSEKTTGGVFKVVQGAVACMAIYIGSSVMIENGPIFWSG